MNSSLLLDAARSFSLSAMSPAVATTPTPASDGLSPGGAQHSHVTTGGRRLAAALRRTLDRDQWRGYKESGVPVAWHIADGALTKEVWHRRSRQPRQILELRARIRLEAQRWRKLGNDVSWHPKSTTTSGRAPEYQLLDDAKHPDGKSRLTAAGSAFGLYPAPAGIVHPAAEWNSSLLIVRGNHVEHWMNGVKLLEYELMSPDWEAKVKASKFGKWPNYGRHPSGYLGIQGDHDGLLALRNIRIRELR